MFYGLLDLPWWGYVLVTLALTHVTIVCVTVFLHRHQAHRALDLHPVVSHFCRLWLWLTTGMDTKAWTAIHRKHHAKCETAEDPHSPIVLGLGKVLWEGAELYRREGKNPETLARYGQGTPDDWLERHVYHPHSAKGILLMFIIYVLLFGIPGITVWAINMAWIPFFAAGVVNGVGHYWGYRNFECRDAATNIVPWGIVIGGEELHNNHHTYPTSAKFSVKPWEFDLGWVYICLLSFVGLVTVKRTVPRPEIIAGKSMVDAHALRVIIVNRIQIMTQYSHDVILPLLNKTQETLPTI
jgi:stearoyl-CoA desaturase (delta-9 desaturase)